ncbi:MAG TPA: oxygen-independent coproporphyrinogen III oxidase [Steroidobacteraceae bacterium]|nr:oxygen-independent coproporphyrinogen III oxidase [Steroidobacteraceae bacterium]
MQALAQLDADLLRRYDMAGPRYTSYPTAREFRPDFGEAEYRRHVLFGHARSTAALSLYVHIPFCESPCFYCGCNRLITRDRTVASRDLDRLSREIALIAPLLGKDRPVRQLHLGGGTPNFLPPGQLARLMDMLGHGFLLTSGDDRDYSVELDPRFLQSGFLDALAQLGFNRASFGVQDFDPVVQRAVNRIQSEEQTLEAIAQCRERGFRSVNVDLLYGLPRQTVTGFGKTLSAVIRARPDRVAVYGYAHLPQLFKAQRQLDEAALPDAGTRLALLRLAIEELGAAGYRYIGLDHFALPGDDLARARERGDLHRNFMGYTTHAECDLIGLGVSAISHVDDCFSQNHRDLKAWEAALDAGRLPVWRGLAASFDDIVRAEVIQRIMCQGVVDIRAVERRHGISLGNYFAEALAKLAPLEADGLVTMGAHEIRATDRGQLLLRLLAMCFDRYLGARAEATEPPRFSKVI